MSARELLFYTMWMGFHLINNYEINIYIRFITQNWESHGLDSYAIGSQWLQKYIQKKNAHWVGWLFFWCDNCQSGQKGQFISRAYCSHLNNNNMKIITIMLLTFNLCLLLASESVRVCCLDALWILMKCQRNCNG